MNFGNIVYTFFIKPLHLLFEVIFSITNRFTANPGISIIFLSLAVNLLVYPLYRRADEMRTEERNLERKLKPRIDQIKKTFIGDERFMMLQTYYRLNNYKPINVLKGSLSLLLEIPFFIAAYNFLSGLELLKGTHFGPIMDLGAPDALISFQSVTINVLPLLMTIINILSAAIYMKGFPLRDKLQTYGMAVIFLVLLYNSPSGLVFYWTLNNVFSLIKNILYKLPDPKKALTLSAAGIAVIGIFFVVIFQPFDSLKKRFFVCGLCLLLLLPLLFSKFTKKTIKITIIEAEKTDTFIFLIGSVYLTIVSGILIPSNIIKTSPGEFINLNLFYNPLWYVFSALLISSGTFLLWFGIYFSIASPQGKKIQTLLMIILSFCSTVNYMFFGTKRGDMSANLIYDVMPSDTVKDYLINIIVLFAVGTISFLLWKKKSRIISALLLPMCLAAFIMSVANIVELNNELPKIKAIVTDAYRNNQPQITLSKKGKNVIILMMDRSIGYLFPFLLDEKPELKEQFSGFNYYPQTISFATKTNGGIPAIYGGYEYIPERINERTNQRLVEKHNEALLMMPKLFGNAGYKVSILNPTYANYKTPSDLSIYENIENVKAYNLDGLFMPHQYQEIAREARMRNFFCHSIYKMAPLILQPTFYTYGSYNEVDVIVFRKPGSGQVVHTILTATGNNAWYEEQYFILKNLNTITKIEEDEFNTFSTLDNATTHNTTLLQLPDYIPEYFVDNTLYEKDPVERKSINGETRIFTSIDQIVHYHINMAAYLMLGKWFDYLRENDVFDNTRIIIVSDHGQSIGFPDLKFGASGWEDCLYFNSILMVKDFYSQGFAINDQFMTNADVPLIAMKDLIDDPVNPATGKSVSDDTKYASEIHVYRVGEWNPKINNGFTFLKGDWAAFSGGDIYDPKNWKTIETR